MSRKLFSFFSFSLLALSLCSQNSFGQFAYNQKILTPERAAVVNPVPTERDFAEINKRHELLMAVIDSGVDYNHPGLNENLHFQLDANGKPLGIGWDYSADDSWPAPLIGIASDLDSNAPADVVKADSDLAKGIGEFLSAYPQYTPMMTSGRHIIQELGGTLYHGTHVAGLMVYDEPRLGLLVYRTFPVNFGYDQGRIKLVDAEDSLPLAIKRAIADGARVINMSLRIDLNKGVRAQDEKGYDQQLKIMGEIRAIAIAHPGVAFVTASGNEGTWIDDNSRLGLPCGINASNILCVGALGQDGEVASFSNVVLPDYPFLLAPGEDIFSFFPTQYCPAPGSFIRALGQLSQIGERQKSSYFKSLAAYCANSGSLYSNSGTSMASPIVARMVAKAFLENQKMTGAEAIQKVLSDSVSASIGRLNVKKLRIEKPSWYPKTINLPFSRGLMVSDEGLSSEPEYFEFYTK